MIVKQLQYFLFVVLGLNTPLVQLGTQFESFGSTRDSNLSPLVQPGTHPLVQLGTQY